MRLVVALGGNALLRRGEPLTATNQRANIAEACRGISTVVPGNEVVIAHGNGPQVGLLALQAAAYTEVEPYPLDVLGAQTEAMIGYVIEQEVGNRLPADRGVVTVLTTTLVSREDPAFCDPTKYVGPVYDAARAQALAESRGWTFRPDGNWYRRVVPSPAPLGIEPLGPIGVLLDLGYVVICGGGGGIPVAAGLHGLEGVEAVVDKDAASVLVAEGLGADLLVIATDVEGVYEGWGTPYPHLLGLLDVVDFDVTSLHAGSMRPKAEAAARFARSGGRAVIGSLSHLPDLVAGRSGTQVVDSGARRGVVPSMQRLGS